MLSQHYRKLNDRAHYFNTLFLLLNHCAIDVPSAPRQATSKKKKALQLPECCVTRQAFIGMLATCCGTWMHLLPQDLARLVALFQAPTWESPFFLAGGEGNSGGRMLRAHPLQRGSASKRGGPHAFKRNYRCHFITLPLGAFSVTEVIVVRLLKKKWERNKNTQRF